MPFCPCPYGISPTFCQLQGSTCYPKISCQLSFVLQYSTFVQAIGLLRCNPMIKYSMPPAIKTEKSSNTVMPCARQYSGSCHLLQ